MGTCTFLFHIQRKNTNCVACSKRNVPVRREKELKFVKCVMANQDFMWESASKDVK
jgi:hypothetical protein